MEKRPTAPQQRARKDRTGRATGDQHLRATASSAKRGWLARGLPFVAIAAFALACALLSQPAPSVDAREGTGNPDSSEASLPHDPDCTREISRPWYEQDGLSKDDWRLALVNPQHPIDPNYAAPIGLTADGRMVDERCLADLERMLADCRAAGLSPFISSAYRTWDYQESLYRNQVDSLRWEGLSEEQARDRAATVVAPPGTSEHQLGLALDIVDEHDPDMTDAQANTPTQQWLLQHSWEYGFVLRYPADKSAITQIVFEPWHYRYVGQPAARTMFEQGICLEEYLAD